MPLEIVTGNIVDQKTDVIVSSNNNRMIASGGNSLAVFEKIGKRILKNALQKFSYVDTTEVAVTSGFDLSKYIIHAVGPVYDEAFNNNETLLADTYINALNKAVELEAESISFPLISAGANGFPQHVALEVAIKTIGSFIEEHDLDVKLVLLPEEKSKKIKYPRLHRMIGRTVLEERRQRQHPKIFSMITKRSLENALEKEVLIREAPEEKILYQKASYAIDSCSGYDLDDILDNMDISFSKTVLNLIDEKGYKDSDVYKRANLDRRLFSKLRSSDDYQPSKSTAIALAFALRLSVPQTDDLLLKAGYSLSKSNTTDIIVEYCLNNEIYNIYEVNELLFQYDQKQLGSI